MARGQNLLTKVFNKPLLITASEITPIADYLSNPERVASLKFEQQDTTEILRSDYSSDESYRKAYLTHIGINPETMTGVLNVDGVLVNREGQMNSQCVELTSYQGLKRQFEAQVAQGITSCVLMVSSGGGEAFGAWSTATYVKKLAKENNVKLTAYVNGSACSAAYVWAVVADEIVSHPMGNSGSIGVLVQLYNDTKMLENMGVQRSFVYAGGNKIPFDDKGAFTDKFIQDLQQSVNNTYEKFVNHVVANRNLSKDEVIATNASVFDAEEAIRLGLVDKIMELEDFEIDYGLKTKATGNKTSLENPISLNKDTSNMKTVEQLQQELDTQAQTLSATQAENTKLLASLADKDKELKAKCDAQEKLQADYDALVKAKAEADADAIFTARKEKLESALGKDNEQVASLLVSTATLSDEQFEVIATSFSTKQEADQKALTEKGGEGQDSKTQMTLSEQIAQRALAHKNKQA